MRKNIKQGESRLFEIPIIDDGNTVDLSLAVNIAAQLNVGTEKQALYTLNSTTESDGLLTIKGVTESDATLNHILVISVDREVSKLFKLGALSAVVITKVPDAAFADGNRETEYQTVIGSVLRGEGKDIDI